MLSDDSPHDYSHVYVVDPIEFLLLHAENHACDKKKLRIVHTLIYSCLILVESSCK